MTEPISPSVCRSANRNTVRKGQRRRNRQARIARLTAPCCAWLGPPGRDRLFAEPHRQAATLSQGSIIFRPVGHPILLLGDVMTAIGIDLEWHSEHPRRLSTWLAASHLGLFGSICRRDASGRFNPDQRPRGRALERQDRPLRYPAQDPSPTDPCNKVMSQCTLFERPRDTGRIQKSCGRRASQSQWPRIEDWPL